MNGSFLIGALTMWLCWGASIYRNSYPDKIAEGKVFKLHDATYQCKQVQKLEYGK